MKKFTKTYYESFHWDTDFAKDPAETERVQEIISVIPQDVQTILDVGCGNGYFVNTLISAFPDRFDRVVGLDYVSKALKYVKTVKIEGSITQLPFKRAHFDLITCLEVIEHLPYEDFKKGILEIERISKKYILVTAPNKENLCSHLAECPICHSYFNPYFHMRIFHKKMMEKLFHNFDLVEVKEIGPTCIYLPQNKILSMLYMLIKNTFHSSTVTICPQCGYRSDKSIPIQNTRFSVSIRQLVRSLWFLKRNRWLLALYKKRTVT